MHTTRQAIVSARMALKEGISPAHVRSALIADGFKPNKADTIMRWANQFIRMTGDYGQGVVISKAF